MIDQDVVRHDRSAHPRLDATVAGWLADLLAQRPQVLLAIAGCPGAGKSSLAQDLVEMAELRGIEAVWLPMDGFHLADDELARQGLADRKGAITTFDADGYLATLRRIRERAGTVYVPSFDRAVEQPIAGSIPIPSSAQLVVTEGNYLLDEREPWRDVRDVVDEVWFCEVDDQLRRERLLRRHIAFGKDPDAARRWIETVDEVNATAVAATRPAATRCVLGLEDGAWVAGR
ncbi:nucleoside/nucleotide kinase family protein [Saccharopolyspora taberi]|uniref:nucleoside/nucleotide kinase family protein n=1 Tax=Saccharopolyspora taberi TaxID=60895 RepID=UPI0031E46D70